MADLLGSVESSFFGLAPPLQRKVKALRSLKNEHAAERDRLIAEEPEVIEEVIPEPPDEDVMMAKFANLLAGMTL
jgi:hypothetical protein